MISKSQLEQALIWLDKLRDICTSGVNYAQILIDVITQQKEDIQDLELQIDNQYEQAKSDILGNMADGGTSCHWCIENHISEALKKQWISVEVKLPDEGDYNEYLITDGTYCYVGHYQHDAKAWKGYKTGWVVEQSGGDLMNVNITHWTPLPKLPEVK